MQLPRKRFVRKILLEVDRHSRLVKIACYGAGALLLVAFGVRGLPGQISVYDVNRDSSAYAESGEILEKQEADDLLCVYVCGRVREPGVYYVARGSRVCDVVESAQGLQGDAAVEALNLAREVRDGEQIIVLSKEELSSQSSGNASGGTALININSASNEQLQQLPGVGPSLAQRIVTYRTTQGAFTNVDDLKKVSGIGDKKLESLRDYICI